MSAEENSLGLILVENVVRGRKTFRVDIPFTSTQPTRFKWPLYHNNSRGVYNGEWKNGYPNGNGIWTNGPKISYNGQWKHGKWNGQGTFNYEDGRVYVGDFVEGDLSGKGTFNYEDGRVYVGDFVEGDFSGKGKLTYLDGKIYDGDWAYGTEHGKGTITWPDGREFEGTFVRGEVPLVLSDGTKNIVKMTYSPGNTYKGAMYKGFSWSEFKPPEKSTVDKAKSLFSGLSLFSKPGADAAEETD
jgi:hypothetical protein